MDNDNDFQVTLRDANSHKSGWFEGVHNCRLGENNFLFSWIIVFSKKFSNACNFLLSSEVMSRFWM